MLDLRREDHYTVSVTFFLSCPIVLLMLRPCGNRVNLAMDIYGCNDYAFMLFFVFRGKAFADTIPYQAHMMFHQAEFHRVNNTIPFLHDMSRHASWQGLN